jgi:hypothetical protein
LQEARFNKQAAKEAGKHNSDLKMACVVLYEGNNTFGLVNKEKPTQLHTFVDSMQSVWPNSDEMYIHATKALNTQIRKLQDKLPVIQRHHKPGTPSVELYR